MGWIILITIIVGLVITIVTNNVASSKNSKRRCESIQTSNNRLDPDAYDNSVMGDFFDREIAKVETVQTAGRYTSTRASTAENECESKPTVRKKLTSIEKKWKQQNEFAKEVFKDQWYCSIDYSHLEPWEAQEKLDRARDRGDWLDDDKFAALRKISNGYYPVTEIPDDIDEENPKEVFDWYLEAYRENRGNLTTDLMKRIAKILKPYHEPYLLENIKGVEPDALYDWMQSCKTSGYFFSTKVYNACKKKHLSQFEKPISIHY